MQVLFMTLLIPSHSHVHVLMCTGQSDAAMKVPHFIYHGFCIVFFMLNI